MDDLSTPPFPPLTGTVVSGSTGRELNLREQGLQRIRDIDSMVDALRANFEQLDSPSISGDTMERLTAIKNQVGAAMTAISVDKAHLDIRRAQEVRARAEEFLANLTDMGIE